MEDKMTRMRNAFPACFEYNPTIYKGRKNEKLNVYPALGKHILERDIGDHIYQQEFIQLMTELGYSSNKKEQYPFRVRPNKYYDWC